jgi:Protein of unknown function (DUF4238)
VVVKKQHVVSAVLLRQWQTNGKVVAVNLLNRTKVHRSPKKIGFVQGFVAADFSVEIENVWSEVENKLPSAIASVADGTIFGDREALEVLRRTMAMHVVRSKQSLRLSAEWFGSNESDSPLTDLRKTANDPEYLRDRYLHRTGLHATAPTQLDAERRHFLEEITAEFAPGGRLFAEQMMIQYERVFAYLEDYPVEIGLAEDGELVIGDNPAVTYDSAKGLAGILAGVSVTEADGFVLPLTPTVNLSIGKSARYVKLTRSETVWLNNLQVALAEDAVYCRIGSGLDDWLLEDAPQVP